MTNPFTSFAFKASGAGVTTARTLPDRLADIKNVKDFGAKGDSVTDDWAAITAAYNWTAGGNRGTIFFPPGTYVVSQPLVFNGDPGRVVLMGVLGASTIIGNFADYVIKRTLSNNTDTTHTVENLTVINTHATGGGIRWGGCSIGAIRNCTVTANQAISATCDDTTGPNGSIDFSIENCDVSPGANVSGSNGIMSVANGPILNCRIIGFNTGMRFWSGQGGMNVLGCYFERNITALAFGNPSNQGTVGAVNVTGCWFKNNGTAIIFGGPTYPSGNGFFKGIRIEADESVIVGGLRPQYGLYLAANAYGTSEFIGITVTGQYEQYGIFIEDVGGFPHISNCVFMAVQSFNTSLHGGLPWHLPSTAVSGRLIECNASLVFTMANLPTPSKPISSVLWSSGTATITITGDISTFPAEPQPVTITGAPAGYNGSFSATITSGTTFTYSVSGPLSPGSGGTALFNPTSGGVPYVFEGDSYNVSDASTSTWGSNPVGGGSTHAKIRWGQGAGTNWTVMGK